jgi:flagellar motor switch protein FliM
MVEKILDQTQIDAMVRAARGGPAAAAETKIRQKKVSPWDARQAGQISREQMHAISLLHEGFARNLTNSVGAYLRIVFNAALVSAEHLTYAELLQRIPEVTYLASIKLEPMQATGVLQLDLSVAYPLIDVLLGGEGKGAPPARELTEIEEQIIETVVRIICRELQTAWQAMSLEFEFDQRQSPQQVQQLMPSEEKTLSMSFEITVAESRGTMNLVVPAVVSNALLRKLSQGFAATRRRARTDSDDRLRRRLLACQFDMELCMNSVTVPISRLSGLEAGGLLLLRRRAEQPGALLVDRRPVFTAMAARRGTVRAAQILERCRGSESEREQES